LICEFDEALFCLL